MWRVAVFVLEGGRYEPAAAHLARQKRLGYAVWLALAVATEEEQDSDDNVQHSGRMYMPRRMYLSTWLGTLLPVLPLPERKTQYSTRLS